MAAAAISGGAHACDQGKAVYQTKDSRTELAFVTPDGAPPATHEVEVRLGALESRAYINPSADVDQPVMTLPYQCPQEDLTAGDLEACIIYRSAVYALSAEDTLTTLPDAGRSAASQILLPNFTAAIYANPALDPLEIEKRPGDIFTLAGCDGS